MRRTLLANSPPIVLPHGLVVLAFAAALAPWRPSLSAEQAPSSKEPSPRPVVAATGTYVQSVKYDSSWSAPNSSGLGSATSCIAYQRPKAVRFVGQHDRTYIVLGDNVCDPVIAHFDHRSRQWSRPVRFGATEVKDDAHGLPAIVVNKEGYIHAVYGAHGTKMYATRSSQPEEIDAWAPPVLASSRGTYSTVFFAGDTLCLFLREQGGQWGFKTSQDGGRTWSDLRVVCRDFPDPAGSFYPVVWIGAERPAPRLHMFWMFYYRRNTWEDMYYAWSDDLGKTWRKASGAPIGQEILYGQGDLVYRGDTHGWQHQVVMDPCGRPGLLFGTGGLPVVEKNDLLFAYWTGQEWRTSKICPLASRYCSGAVVIKGRDHYRAYVANGRWNGGEIAEFETVDGGRDWERLRDITSNSPEPNAFPAVVENGFTELQIIWCSGEKGKVGNVFAWGEAGTLPAQPDPAIRD